MLKIYVQKVGQKPFCLFLNKQDGKAFLKHFKGEKVYLFDKGDRPFDFDMDCVVPKHYRIQVFECGREDYKKAMDLMDGDI